MRFIVMHKTNTHWESGATPERSLVERVGAMIGEMQAAGILLAGEGLRPSSEGVRVRFGDGSQVATQGPFEPDNELLSGFSIVRAPSIGDAVDWAAKQAAIAGDAEVDIRPVTEPWDIGLEEPPAAAPARRYMVARKATTATEEDTVDRTRLSRMIHELTQDAAHVVSETLAPSRRGRRYLNSRNGVSVYDGPFIESKELLGGYVIIAAPSLDAADPWARRYLETVDAHEVEVRELE